MSKLYKWFIEEIGFSGLYILTIVFAIIIILIAVIIENVNGLHDNNKHIRYLKSRIGDKYIMNKDTIIVLEFNEINNMYILSNGNYVIPEIIYKSKKVK